MAVCRLCRYPKYQHDNGFAGEAEQPHDRPEYAADDIYKPCQLQELDDGIAKDHGGKEDFIAFVSSFTSSDVASFMTRELYDSGQITEISRRIRFAPSSLQKISTKRMGSNANTTMGSNGC